MFYSPWDFFTHRSEEFVCTYYNVRCPRSFFLIKWRWILAFIELFEKITHFTFYQRTALPNQYCHPRVQLKCTLIKLGLNLKSQFQSNRIQFLICRDNVIWFQKPRIIYLTRKLHHTYVHVSWLLGDNTQTRKALDVISPPVFDIGRYKSPKLPCYLRANILLCLRRHVIYYSDIYKALLCWSISWTILFYTVGCYHFQNQNQIANH